MLSCILERKVEEGMLEEIETSFGNII